MWSVFIDVLIFTGGGGVGKSYLIITLAKWLTKILLGVSDPIKAKVLLLAFTGVAASLIGKIIAKNETVQKLTS